jgi:hypothetical protein
MIKSLIIRFFAAFSSPSHVREKERESIVEARKSIRLKGSEAERLAAIKEWSKAENIIKRVEEHRMQAATALERAERMSKEVRAILNLPERDPPLPDPLPKEFEGQSPSTIRAILRQRQDEEYTRGLLL